MASKICSFPSVLTAWLFWIQGIQWSWRESRILWLNESRVIKSMWLVIESFWFFLFMLLWYKCSKLLNKKKNWKNAYISDWKRRLTVVSDWKNSHLMCRNVHWFSKAVGCDCYIINYTVRHNLHGVFLSSN